MDEKLDILYFDFRLLWYKIFLNNVKDIGYYLSQKAKFERIYLKDGGRNLRLLIANSTSISVIWEIPKGKKEYFESDLQCAVREFREETGIDKKYYQFIPSFKRTYSFIEEHITYIYTYYIGMYNTKKKITLNMGRESQISESSDIKWMTLDEIKLIDTKMRLQTIITPIFAYIKKNNLGIF